MATKVPLILALLAAHSMALAEGDSMFKLSGYGTLAGTHSSNDQADFRSNFFQPNGAGYTRATDVGTDSKLAVQLDAFFLPKLSATVQALAQRNHDKTFTPKLEWANLKFKPIDSFYVRAGRIAAPTFMVAEYRNVGYAQTMVRPSNDVYFLSPVFNVDGLDVGYSTALGESSLSLQLAAGKYEQNLTTPRGYAKTKVDTVLFNSTLEYGDASFRFGYTRESNLTFSSDLIDLYNRSLAALVAYNVPKAATVRSNIRFDDLDGSLVGLGVSYDPGSWLLQSEIIWRKFDTNSTQDARAWYLMGGKRLGKWTPYAAYSQMKSTEDYNLPVIDASAYPAQLQGAATVVNAVNYSQMYKYEQSTYSLGVRYDVWNNMDLKLQFDHIDKPAGAIGVFTQNQPGFVESQQHANIVTLAFDFVF